MAPHFANEFPSHLLMWQRVREYAVPPSMIETATARRAVGDWAGACAAARIDVDLDLRAVRDRHGTELVTRLRADLRRLAPDLLRWHMPRVAPDGRLRPGLTVCLARYPGSGTTPLQLVVRTPPPWADAGQRMSLTLWEGAGSGGPAHHPHPRPARRFRLDLHRHLWDAARSGELARRCGADGVPSSRSRAPDSPLPPNGSPWAVARWAAEAELLLRAEGHAARGAFTVRLGARHRAVWELVAPDDSHAPTLRPLREVLPPQEVAALPVLPEAAARVLPDLELLRAGLVPAERLHPLVATALTASGTASTVGRASVAGPASMVGRASVAGPASMVGRASVAGPASMVGAAPVAGPAPAPPPGDPHRVECRGEVHRIALRDGVLTPIDHDPTQLRREELLMALGGPGLPCLRAIDAAHRAPEALPAVHERLAHGDVVGALDVVEGLLGPGAVLRDGPLRDALESAAARRVDSGLFRAGLVAVRPGAAAVEGGDVPGGGQAAGGRRPRPDRRVRAGSSGKRSIRSRPRFSLFR
ncbi:hypothetical protein [Streptomyces sp. NPDC003077]|uniref:hypothetical protein n=1 Tax=Streptomyces sp. NPDC003077 TaxID=3154443 RepID=UPI0033AE49E1